ncbi:MAG: hypothetical protein NTY74_14170 [Ignavibacteriae bacterium]|nr:hypothetical protein [Ignavibacteriota bacterium]
MKIIKSKIKGDKFEFYIELETGEKFGEMAILKYEEMKNVINSYNNVIKNFIIRSGKVVLTSIGDSEFGANIKWDIPTGCFDAYIHNDKNEDWIFIPFRKFESEIVQCQSFMTAIHLKNCEESFPLLTESQGFQTNGEPIFLMDEAEWLANQSIVYSKNNASYEETTEELSKGNPEEAHIVPFELSDNSKLSEVEDIKIYYLSYVGYTLEGDPAYLWLRKIKQDDKE